MIKFNFLFATLLALFIALPARAQVKLGVMGGANFANLNGNDVDGSQIDFSSRTGFGLGGVLDIRLSKDISLRFTPMYLQKGGELNDTDPDLGEETFAYKIGYLEVPALLKIDFGKSSVRPYLLAGPTIGFNLSSKLDYSVPSFSEEIDAKDITESTDLALTFGAGASFPTGASVIFVESRYALGLSDIAKEGVLTLMGEDLVSGDADVQTRGFQLMAGMSFPLGSK